MNKIELPYGKTNISIHLPEDRNFKIIAPHAIVSTKKIVDQLHRVIDMPLAALSLATIRKNAKIAIAINDKTRPVPNSLLLPPLLDKLSVLGFRASQITFFIASGTHTPMLKEEFSLILPEDIIRDYQVVAHDCDNAAMLDLGQTSRGTPILVNAAYARADVKMVVGNIEPHHFMGYSGGVKSAAIGLTSRETINRNHAMLTDIQAVSGSFNQNPMRQDVEEIGQRIKVNYALNTVMDQNKQVLDVFFGEPLAVMQAAIPLVNRIYKVPVEQHYDLVIVSPGGHPKDINLYQAQKGLTHAARITKDNGWIILLAACPEGAGSDHFEAYVHSKNSYQQILADFSTETFSVGPHKAFQIARDAVRTQIILVTDMPEEVVKGLYLEPCSPKQVNAKIAHILESLPSSSPIALMPMGTTTIPTLKIK